MSTFSSVGTSSISGLISGLDVDAIIQKMVQFAQQPIQTMQNKQAGLNSEITAWQGINTSLLSLKSAAGTLANSYNMQAKSVSSSDTSALTASATSAASAGTYNITINRLAQAEQRISQSYSDTSTTVGTGSITVGVGTDTAKITLDSSNDTLSGLRDAINNAKAGLTASIVDYGSGSDHAYHLQLTSSTTGADNAITFDTSSLSGGTAPTWTTQSQAQDASITVGPTGNTTEITKSTNTINDIYSGLTLNLLKADTGTNLTVKVTNDTDTISSNIQNFVTQYNSIMDTINNQFTYDSSSNTQGGALFGDFTLQTIQQDLLSSISSASNQSSGSYKSLSQIGLTLNSSNELVLDQSALTTALQSDPDSVTKLFSTSGQATDSKVSYVSSTTATKASSGGYAIRVDQAATQARVTAGAAQAENLAADETLSINGVNINLTAGMTAQNVVDTINQSASSTGVTASRTSADGTGTGNYLTLTRNAYGSNYSISAYSTLTNGGDSPTDNTAGIGRMLVTQASAAGESGTGSGAAGKNISGAFGVTVNGVTTWEAATGIGQILTGSSGNANTEGLSVKVNATSTGQYGTVSLNLGVGGALNSQLDFLTNTTNGTISTTESSLTSQIADIQTEIDNETTTTTNYENQLRTEYQNLETQLGNLQGTSSYLTSQIQALDSKS